MKLLGLVVIEFSSLISNRNIFICRMQPEVAMIRKSFMTFAKKSKKNPYCANLKRLEKTVESLVVFADHMKRSRSTRKNEI